MYDIVALGELLIDFTPQGLSEKGNYMFEANPGGAPCNVLAAMAKLGKSAAFIGKIGADTFGVLLKNTLNKLKIGTDGLKMTDEYFTTLAFVTIDETGNQSFDFSRNNSADVMLMPDEVDKELIKNARIFHCGTLSLTHESSKAATLLALETAKKNGVLISVDPNLREPLWKDKNDARKAIDTVISYADIIKISDYEIEFMTNETNITLGAKILYEKYRPKIMFATCGKDGAYLLKGNILMLHPCYSNVKTIDTTGAGDSFCGAALSKLIDCKLDFSMLSEDKGLSVNSYCII